MNRGADAPRSPGFTGGFKHGWSEAFQNPFLDVRKIEDLMPELVGVDHGDRTKRLKASSHGTFSGADAANHAQNGDDFWQCTQGMKDSKRRKEPGRNVDRRIWELANQSVRLGAFQSRPARKAGGRVANIVPSGQAGVNNAAKDSGFESMN